MSVLVDKLIHNAKDTQTEFNGKWFVARPYGKYSLPKRIKEAWLVLTNRASTFHYKADEKGYKRQ